MGSARRAARRTVADVGFARGTPGTPRSSWRRRAGSHVGITGGSCGTGAFLGRAAALIGSASGARSRASTALRGSACARPFLGRAGCARAFMGRSRTGSGSTSG